jgi:hypothetical protein
MLEKEPLNSLQNGLLKIEFSDAKLRFVYRSMDCTLEMRQPGWAHFAGKGLQSEAKAILTEVPADGS